MNGIKTPHGQRRNSSCQKEVTFPKAQSNCFTAGQAIYVVCPESKMKTSTGMGSSLVLYCLQRPSRTYPQTPLGRWRRRLKATVDKKRNWGVQEGARETLVHEQENQHDRWKRLARMNPKTLRSCLQLTSAQARQRVDSVSRRLRDCSVGCSIALAQHQGHVKVSHGTCNEADAKY